MTVSVKTLFAFIIERDLARRYLARIGISFVVLHSRGVLLGVELVYLDKEAFLWGVVLMFILYTYLLVVFFFCS